MHPALTSASRGVSARRARGSAMVEFALLNIILIPLFLYALFLMDAAYLKLDLQETVVSGVWDFSQRNTEVPAWGGMGKLDGTQNRTKNNNNELQGAMRAVRVVYADHTSAFDDGAVPGRTGYGQMSYLTGNGNGSEHMKHHTGFGAQYSFRFRNGPDTQFMCSVSNDLSWNEDPNMTSFGTSGYNSGGEVKCEATGFIYNYIIPQEFLQEFSHVKITQMKLRKNTTAEGVHEWQGEGGNLSNIVADEVAGISFNTWALRNGATNTYQSTTDEEGNTQSAPVYDGALADANLRVPESGVPMPASQSSPEGNPFFRRVQYLYTENGTAALTYGRVAMNAAQYMQKAQNEKIMLVENMVPGAMSGGMLPNITGVHMTVRYKPGSPGQQQNTPGLVGGKKYYTTPYSGPDNNYQTAASARGFFYMGCKNAENPDCF